MKPLRELSQDERAALSDDEIFELVATDIEARQRGGPNRKAEHLALARSAEMAEEAIHGSRSQTDFECERNLARNNGEP